MKYIRLLAVTDHLDDTPGLILKDMPRFDDMFADREGGLIAHDLVEHQNGCAAMGSVWDELQALGGIWHTRGRWGELGGYLYSPTHTLSFDITRMFGLSNHEHKGQARPHDYDDDFHDIIAHARREIDDDCDGYLSHALDHLRTGYRKACARFGHDSQSYDLYMAVKDAVSKISIDFVGQEFTLAYGNGKAVIHDASF